MTRQVTPLLEDVACSPLHETFNRLIDEMSDMMVKRFGGLMDRVKQERTAHLAGQVKQLLDQAKVKVMRQVKADSIDVNLVNFTPTTELPPKEVDRSMECVAACGSVLYNAEENDFARCAQFGYGPEDMIDENDWTDTNANIHLESVQTSKGSSRASKRSPSDAHRIDRLAKKAKTCLEAKSNKVPVPTYSLPASVHSPTDHPPKKYLCKWPHCSYGSCSQFKLIRHVAFAHFRKSLSSQPGPESNTNDPRLYHQFVEELLRGKLN